MAERQLLKNWILENPPNAALFAAEAARNQMIWVRDVLSYMVWNSLLPPTIHWDIDARDEMVTVDGTHVSKSATLPVYRFDVGGVTTKIRGNFYDWCVRCYTPMKRDFPDWMRVSHSSGCFEGMDRETSPVTFCVSNREQMYTALWWMYNEGLGREKTGG